MRKKVDSRIRTLIENGVKENVRSLFVLVGDRGKDQVVNLHYMLSKAVVKSRPSVLWCYKKELGFSSHKQKRMKQIKKMVQRGLLDPEKDDPFEMFVSSTNIRYTYYSESHKILGNTFGMCVLQDFEALTPNLLARTIETVEGGGIIVLLLRTMTSLRQLFSMAMDVHSRYRSEKFSNISYSRFNERFLLSIAKCKSCLVVDDELNILPVSSHARHLTPVSRHVGGDDDKTSEDVENAYLSEADKQLRDLKSSLADTGMVGNLVGLAKTVDQAKGVMTFLDAITEKSLQATVSMTASRGRGKSAALGLAVAGAVAYGYANIFVTSPSPENLSTFFQFVFKGLDALSFKEHQDYDVVQSTNPEFNKAVVRVNIYRNHRQTIQYVDPLDARNAVSMAELFVIDEAAAIPLPAVRALFGPYLIFMASTVHGYEGTGRALSLKLLQQLRTECRVVGPKSHVHHAGAPVAASSLQTSGRTLREIQLSTPIRYSSGDSVEEWLNGLLCFDCDAFIPKQRLSICPHPKECELYYVNRDTLFSFHSASEVFLKRMVGLFVSSHYKNQPNDLQLMADAPAHHVFVLLPPLSGPQGSGHSSLPEILCVIQVCLEGEISKQALMKNLSRGFRPQGDLIPYLVSQQYQDTDFPQLSGARVVRIATNPSYTGMGYGSRALDLLYEYYAGNVVNVEEVRSALSATRDGSEASSSATGGGNLLTEAIAPRSHVSPLLQKLTDRPPEPMQYLGVSYGLTSDLLKFWLKAEFLPVYVRQTMNETTGEHTIVMLRRISASTHNSLSSSTVLATSESWLKDYYDDFRRRFMSLLGYEFSKLSPVVALSLLQHRKVSQSSLSALNAAAAAASSVSTAAEDAGSISKSDLDQNFSVYDCKRLDSYSRNLIDYHVIVDLMPSLTRLYFLSKFNLSLSFTQELILLSVGLQHKTVDELEPVLNLPVSQILALFNKVIRKASSGIRRVHEIEAEHELEPVREVGGVVGEAEEQEDLDDELQSAGKEVTDKLKKKQQEQIIRGLGLESVALGVDDKEWADAIKDKKGIPSSISVKTTRVVPVTPEEPSSDKKRREGRDDRQGSKKKQSRK